MHIVHAVLTAFAEPAPNSLIATFLWCCATLLLNCVVVSRLAAITTATVVCAERLLV